MSLTIWPRFLKACSEPITIWPRFLVDSSVSIYIPTSETDGFGVAQLAAASLMRADEASIVAVRDVDGRAQLQSGSRATTSGTGHTTISGGSKLEF